MLYNTSMDEKFLVLDNAAFAYYFMHHNYRKYQVVEFTEQDLLTFLDYFSYFASDKNFVLLNSEKKVLLEEDAQRTVVDSILDNFCVFLKHDGTQKHYCVDFECLSKMSRAYDYATPSFKQLVIDYETQYVIEAYSNKKALSNFESLIKSDAKRLKSRVDKNQKENNFDA